MTVLKFQIFLFFSFFLFCSCNESVEINNSDEKQEIVHHIERYCFQDSSCTNTVYVKGSDFTISDYFKDQCTLKNLKFKFIEDTVFTKPIVIEESNKEINIEQLGGLVNVIGYSILYDDYFQDCLDMGNFFIPGVKEYNVDGHLSIFNEDIETNLIFKYNPKQCLYFNQIRCVAKKLEKQKYLLNFNQAEFSLSCTFSNLDLGSPNNISLKRLIDLSLIN